MEPSNQQVDARPSLHRAITFNNAPIAPPAPPNDLQIIDANPRATQPVISQRTDEIDAPILRTVTFDEEESTHSRAGTSDALPDSTHARNTTTDDAEECIAQLAQSIGTELNQQRA